MAGRSTRSKQTAPARVPEGGKSQPPPADLMPAVVQTLAAHGIVRNYPKNAIIITEGDPSDSLYIILSGRVKVFLSDDGGKEIVLDVHGSGSYVGEMAFDEQPRSASVVTLEPCTLSMVTQARFREFLKKEPQAVEHLIRSRAASPARA